MSENDGCTMDSTHELGVFTRHLELLRLFQTAMWVAEGESPLKVHTVVHFVVSER